MDIKKVKGYLLTSFLANDNAVRKEITDNGVKIVEAPDAIALVNIVDEENGQHVSTASLIPIGVKVECENEKYNNISLNTTNDFSFRFVIEFSDYEFFSKKNAGDIFEMVEKMLHGELVGEKKKMDTISKANGRKKSKWLETKETSEPVGPIMLSMVNTGFKEELNAALAKKDFIKITDGLYKSSISKLMDTAEGNVGLKFM